VKTIIVLDENESLRELLDDVLADVDGWTVKPVANGSDLLTIIETVTPDLIILDTGVPGLNGMEVYGLLRGHAGCAEIPVLFISTGDEQDTKGVHGPSSWLTKPFEVDDLLTVAAEMLGENTPENVG